MREGWKRWAQVCYRWTFCVRIERCLHHRTRPLSVALKKHLLPLALPCRHHLQVVVSVALEQGISWRRWTCRGRWQFSRCRAVVLVVGRPSCIFLQLSCCPRPRSFSMEEGGAEDPTRGWIAFYAMAVAEGTPSSSYPKSCHIWHNLHRRLTSCGGDFWWPMTCSLSTRGRTTFLDYCPEFWVQVSVEESVGATKPATRGVVGCMCRSCGGDKWPVAAAAACQSKSSCRRSVVMFVPPAGRVAVERHF